MSSEIKSVDMTEELEKYKKWNCDLNNALNVLKANKYDDTSRGYAEFILSQYHRDFAGYKAAIKSIAVSGDKVCRWVKASERMSLHYENVCCRKMDFKEFWFTAYYDNSRKVYMPSTGYGSNWYLPEDIEWLEEIPAPVQEGKIYNQNAVDAVILGLLKWLKENNWLSLTESRLKIVYEQYLESLK